MGHKTLHCHRAVTKLQLKAFVANKLYEDFKLIINWN